jgi:hypothetical protein
MLGIESNVILTAWLRFQNLDYVSLSSEYQPTDIGVAHVDLPLDNIPTKRFVIEHNHFWISFFFGHLSRGRVTEK